MNITLSDANRTDLADLINHYSQENLTEEACNELAFFLEDVFNDGIELHRLKLIAEEAREYDSFDKLMNDYLNEDEIEEIRTEAEENDNDFEEDIIERIQDNGSTILRVGGGSYVVID